MKLFNRLKFRTQLNISFTIITLFIIVTIMLMLHFILRESYRERESLILKTYGRQIVNNIDNRVDYFISYLKLLANDRELIESMEKDSYQKVSALLDRITEEFVGFNAERISGIKLHRSGIYKKADGLENTEAIFDKFVPGSAFYRDNYFITGTYLNSRNEKVFSIFQKVYQTNPNREYYIEMCIYETELFGFFNEDSGGNRISIFYGDMLMSMNNREQFSKLLYQSKNKGNIGVSKADLGMPDRSIRIVTWKGSRFDIVIEANTAYLDRAYRMMLVRLVPIIAGVLLVAFIFAALISGRLNFRMKTLQEKIAAISSWKLEKELRIDGNDEFGILADELDETRKRIIALIEQNNRINEQKRAAEVSALRAQINSHFLFNSLSSIKWLAKRDDMDALSDAVDKLALFLRYSLSLSENQVALSSELQHLEAYIYLQKLRYGDEINVHIDIDDELLECKTVKLILQPLVENAIYHGRRENGNQLNITIYSYSDDKFYYLVVEDDGNGIPPHIISDIYENKADSSKGGYGLRNVMQRVSMCSGGLGEVSIESVWSVCTKITIKQPL